MQQPRSLLRFSIGARTIKWLALMLILVPFGFIQVVGQQRFGRSRVRVHRATCERALTLGGAFGVV